MCSYPRTEDATAEKKNIGKSCIKFFATKCRLVVSPVQWWLNGRLSPSAGCAIQKKIVPPVSFYYVLQIGTDDYTVSVFHG